MASFTIAIMQPYFIPYTGYFRLFAASDLFVIYDCVQFTRQGWVHRNRLVDVSGNKRWLTLPLAKAPQSVLIRDLQFASNAEAVLMDRLRPFSLAALDPIAAAPVLDALRAVGGHPVDYIACLLERIVTYLGLPWTVIRSSSLDVPASFHGQDRILEIARRLGATRYVNASGGQDLYKPASFADAGIDLKFLPAYPGPTVSILARILREGRAGLCRDTRSGSVIM